MWDFAKGREWSSFFVSFFGTRQKKAGTEARRVSSVVVRNETTDEMGFAQIIFILFEIRILLLQEWKQNLRTDISKFLNHMAI